MFKKTHSNSKHSGRSLRKLELRVNSPRIALYGLLRHTQTLIKLGFYTALIVGAVWGARFGINRYFVENPEFQLQRIALDTNGVITEERLYELTQITPFESIFKVDLQEAERLLQAEPNIISVKVDRLLPDTVTFQIVERRPVAWLEYRPQGIIGRSVAHGLLIDKEGNLFNCTEAHWADAARLPVVIVTPTKSERFRAGTTIRHGNAKRLIDLAVLASSYLQTADWNLPHLSTRNAYSFHARTSEGARIIFGLDDHERQMADLVTLVQHTRSTGRRLATANLIPQKNIPITYFGQNNHQPSPPHELPVRPPSQRELDEQEILNRS